MRGVLKVGGTQKLRRVPSLLRGFETRLPLFLQTAMCFLSRSSTKKSYENSFFSEKQTMLIRDVRGVLKVGGTQKLRRVPSLLRGFETRLPLFPSFKKKKQKQVFLCVIATKLEF